MVIQRRPTNDTHGDSIVIGTHPRKSRGGIRWLLTSIAVGSKQISISTVLDALLESIPVTPGEARGYLARFLFRGDDVMKEVRLLSGGERSRLELALLGVMPSNVYLLDEPFHVTAWGYRFVGGAGDNTLTVTADGGRLRFHDRSISRWTDLCCCCRRIPL